MKLMSPKRLGKSGNILYYPKRQETYFYHVVYTPYETRLLRTPDIKGLLGCGHPRNTACGCVNYSRIIGMNVSDWRLINETHGHDKIIS